MAYARGSLRIGWVAVCVFSFAPIWQTPPSQSTSVEAEQHSSRGMDLARSGNLVAAEQELNQAVSLQPDHATFQAQLGSILALQGKLAESIPLFEKAIALDPAAMNFRVQIASVQWQLGSFDQAAENLQVVLAAHRDDASATLLLGLVRDSQGNCEDALKLLNSQRSLVLQRPERALALLHSQYACRHPAEAQETVDLFVSKAPDPVWQEGVYSAVHLATDTGNVAQATQLLNAVASHASNPSRFQFESATLDYRTGNFVPCQAKLLELEKTVQQNQWLETVLARCLAENRQFDEALLHADRAMRIDPAKLSSYETLVSIYIKESDFDSASHWAENAIKRFPEGARAWSLKGSVEMKTDHFRDAIASYRRATTLNPGDPDALIGLANAQLLGGKLSEAQATYEKGIQKFPTNSRFYVGEAATRMQSADDLSAAASEQIQGLLRQAIALEDTDPATHYLMGQTLLDQHKTKEALAELLLAEKLDPGSSRVHFALERAYRRLGMPGDARKEFALFEQQKGAEDNDLMRGQGNPANE